MRRRGSSVGIDRLHKNLRKGFLRLLGYEQSTTKKLHNDNSKDNSKRVLLYP